MDVIFYILTFIIFLNLNGVVDLFLNIKAPFSPLILASTLVALAIFVNRKAKVGVLMWSFTFAMVTYVVLGIVSYGWMTFENINSVGIMKPARDVITSTMITVTFYLMFRMYKEQNKYNSRLNAVFICGVISVLITIFGMQLGFYDNMQGVDMAFIEQRNMGVFANPNQAGLQANIILIILLYFFLTSSKHKWLLLLLLPLVVYASFRTFSKAAIIATVFVFAIFAGSLFINPLKISSRARYGLLAMLIVISGISGYIITNIEDIVQGFDINQMKRVALSFELVVNGEINNETTSNRNELIAHGWEMIKERPLLGSGLGSFHRYVGPGFTHGSHNQFFNILGESGIFPFVMILLFFILTTWRVFCTNSTAIQFFGFAIVFLLLFEGLATQTLLREKSVCVIIGVLLAYVEKTDIRWT